jgi:hypothetical protein
VRVLLINTNQERAPQPVIPLGLCLVATAVEAHGFKLRVLDLCFSRRPATDIASAVARWQPGAICLSIRNLDNGDYLATRKYLPAAADIVGICRARSAVPIIIGGPAVSIAPAQVLRSVGADYAIVGDGERALPELLSRLAVGSDTSDLVNVCSRTSQTPAQPARITDLHANLAAHPCRWLDIGRYLRSGSPYPIQSKRGCAFECIYCTYRFIEGDAYRLRPPETVAAEIEQAHRRWGVRRFEFVDSIFGHPLDHALATCEAIIRAGVKARFATSALNPAAATPELLTLMKRAGFDAVVCTPDSGSDIVLGRLRKGFTASHAARVAGWAGEAGLPTLWSFLLGAPGETEDTLRETIDFMDRALGPRDRILCTVGLRVYPGTPLEKIAHDEGALPAESDPLDPRFYLSSQIPLNRVLELIERASRSAQIIHLHALQQPLITWSLRIHSTLRLRMPPWSAVPLYNRLRRALPHGRTRPAA